MNNEMMNLYEYLLIEYPAYFNSDYVTDMLYNILVESQKIDSMSLRCNWLDKMIPGVRLSEIRDVLLR